MPKEFSKQQKEYFELAKANKPDPFFKKLAIGIYAKSFLNKHAVINNSIVDFEYIEAVHQTSIIKGPDFYGKLIKAMPFEKGRIADESKDEKQSNQEKVFLAVLAYCKIKIG